MNGFVNPRLGRAALLLLLAGCSEQAAPTIVRWVASPMSVVRGQTAELQWQVESAESIHITNLRSGEALIDSAEASGVLTVMPLDDTTAFALVARGAETETSQTLTLQVSAAPAPVVDRFEASPQTIFAGDSATLSWATTGAQTVDLEAEGVQLGTKAPASGTLTVQPTQTTVYNLVAHGPANQVARATTHVTVSQPALRPRVRSFVAAPSAVVVGDSTTLSWQVTGAETVRIVGGATEVYSGGLAQGQVILQPPSSATYRLLATNPEGSDEATLTVQVNLPTGPQIAEFSANPRAVQLGQAAELTWRVSGCERIEITGAGRTATVSEALQGSVLVSPSVTTTYTLTALDAEGQNTAQLTVEVGPSPPVILSFTASANAAAVGDATTLRWSTLGAAQVVLRRGLSVEASGLTASGFLDVPVTTTSTTFTLEALNPDGTNTAALTIFGHVPPEVVSFGVSPSQFTGATTAQLSWEVRGVETLTLFEGANQVASFPGLQTGGASIDDQGLFDWPVSATTVFRLVATSRAGQVESSATITQQGP